VKPSGGKVTNLVVVKDEIIRMMEGLIRKRKIMVTNKVRIRLPFFIGIPLYTLYELSTKWR
jgi:hypothetical protein